jgi:hypothetical protein
LFTAIENKRISMEKAVNSSNKEKQQNAMQIFYLLTCMQHTWNTYCMFIQFFSRRNASPPSFTPVVHYFILFLLKNKKTSRLNTTAKNIASIRSNFLLP